MPETLHLEMTYLNLKLMVLSIYFKTEKVLKKEYKLTPYGFLGIGLLYHNPKGYFAPEDEWVALQPLGTEGQNLKRKRS